MRRAAIVSSIGLIVVVVLMRFVPWGLAVVVGWDAAALTFLIFIWPIILRADAAQLATREDETRGTAAVLLVGASVASLLGVGLVLHLAGRESGSLRVLLIGVAVLRARHPATEEYAQASDRVRGALTGSAESGPVRWAWADLRRAATR